MEAIGTIERSRLSTHNHKYPIVPSTALAHPLDLLCPPALLHAVRTFILYLIQLSLIFLMDSTADSRPAVPWPGLETSPGRMMLAWGKGKLGWGVDRITAYRILVD